MCGRKIPRGLIEKFVKTNTKLLLGQSRGFSLLRFCAILHKALSALAGWWGGGQTRSLPFLDGSLSGARNTREAAVSLFIPPWGKLS